MVFQDYALFPHMTVAENVGFGLKLKRGGRAEARERIDEMLSIVRLDGYADRRPAQLSGGQRQRVALARALVNRPAALLLDEPLGALDLKLRREMQLELKRIQKTTGTTFVYVTHDQEEALTMSDRIAVMDGGKVQQLASPKTLYEQPRTSFVADFIGTSNALELIVDRIEGGLAVMQAEPGTRVAVAAECRVGDLLQISVRPEKIKLRRDDGQPAPANGECLIRGVAIERVYLGSISQTVVQLRGGERLSVHELNDDDVSVIEPGDAVTLTWPARHSLVVESAGGDAA
jgi:spermidine/putrescine transport system ATP-binding protein